MSDSARIGEHIAAMLLHLAKGNEDSKVTIFEDEIAGSLSTRFNLECPSLVIEQGLGTLRELGALATLISPFTGPLYEVDASVVDYYFDGEGVPGIDDFGYYEDRRELLNKFPVIRTYYRGGRAWLDRAVASMSQMDLLEFPGSDVFSFGILPEEISIPASDRIVTLTDNARGDLDKHATDLVEAVVKENAIEGNARLRDKILGQIKAGRELIRAQTFSAYLLYQTLLSTLGGLIERYKDHAIGIAAAKLLELLIEHVFGNK